MVGKPHEVEDLTREIELMKDLEHPNIVGYIGACVSIRYVYCTALSSIALHCTVLHCPVLHSTALSCPPLHSTIMYCIVLSSTALHRIVLYGSSLSCTTLYRTELFSALSSIQPNCTDCSCDSHVHDAAPLLPTFHSLCCTYGTAVTRMHYITHEMIVLGKEG